MNSLIVFIALAFSGAALGAPVAYLVTPIPVPAGLTVGSMYGINDAGQSVGTAFQGKTSFAFLYNGTSSNLIPPPTGWTQSAAYAINNSGEVVGFVNNGTANANQSFLYNGSISIVIPSPTGSTYSQAQGINDSGEVVGFGYGGNLQAFVNNGPTTAVIPSASGITGLSAYGISSSGQVTGYGTTATTANQAFTYNGSTVSLIPLAGWNSMLAYAINSAGDVAGWGLNGFVRQPFLYDGSTTTPIPLPNGATVAQATIGSLNDSGQVVGYSDAGGWIWDSMHGTVLLNTLVPAGWNITNAVSISNNGLVLAYGSYNSGPGGYVELRAAATSAPVISSVENAFGNSATIAPNTWVAIKGSSLAPAGDSRIWQDSDFAGGQMPAALDGVSVTMNGESVYVYYISPTQLNILTPPDLASGAVQVQVAVNGLASASFTVQALPESPSVFVFNGGPYVIATHLNNSIVGPTSLYPGASTPAQAGEEIVMYANGFGPTSSPIVKGSETQSGTLPSAPSVQINGAAAEIIFAGLVSPGLYQFNVVVPMSAAHGDNTLSIQYNGQSTQSGVLLTVQ